MIGPGPCRYHWGSSVRVGDKVSVGRGVSEGMALAVYVGKAMGVMVAG